MTHPPAETQTARDEDVRAFDRWWTTRKDELYTVKAAREAWHAALQSERQRTREMVAKIKALNWWSDNYPIGEAVISRADVLAILKGWE